MAAAAAGAVAAALAAAAAQVRACMPSKSGDHQLPFIQEWKSLTCNSSRQCASTGCCQHIIHAVCHCAHIILLQFVHLQRHLEAVRMRVPSSLRHSLTHHSDGGVLLLCMQAAQVRPAHSPWP